MPDDWRVKARAMKDADPARSNASIARELGVDTSMVWRLFNPAASSAISRRVNARRGAAKRAWENENDRGICKRCGARTSVGAARKGRSLCIECCNADRRAQRLKRARQIEQLWHAGATLKEIAAALDTTPGSVAVAIARLRAEGLADLPYRRVSGGGGMVGS